jgi:hypothetical protein
LAGIWENHLCRSKAPIGGSVAIDLAYCNDGVASGSPHSSAVPNQTNIRAKTKHKQHTVVMMVRQPALPTPALYQTKPISEQKNCPVYMLYQTKPILRKKRH